MEWNKNITVNDVANQNDPKVREKIVYTLLKDTGNLNRFKASDVQEVKLYSGDILGKGNNDLFVTAKFGPTITLAGVYEKTDNGYKFVQEIGPFNTIDSVELKDSDVFNRDIIVIREFVNQNIGAFEEAFLFRGYLYDDETGRFNQIFKIPESQKANWNRLWDLEDLAGRSLWERVTSDVDIEIDILEGGSTIRVNQFQQFLVSSDVITKSVPDDSTYSVVKERTFSTDYKWSPKWKRFIIGEGIDKNTGQTVAILEDFGDSPYALVPEYENFSFLYKILRPNGIEEGVSKNTITPI